MLTVYPPSENTIEYPQLNIFIPYTDIKPATLIALIGYNYMPVKLEGDYGYYEYFKKRWDERKTFINIEHDVVVYPSALEAIWNCPEEWCAYDYHLPIHRKQSLGSNVPLGCVKFSPSFIEKTHDLWSEPVKWNVFDVHIAKLGLSVHQHYPSVVNASEALLGFTKYS